MKGLGAVLVVLLGGAAAAGSSAGQKAYYEAIGLHRAGQAAEARARLDLLAVEQPDDRFADDALFKAAEISERDLLDLPGALQRYRSLIEHHPRSRLLRRARNRLQYLSDNREAGDRVLLEFEKVIRETPLSDLERTRQGIERLQKLLGEHPDFPQAARGRYWIAEAHFKLGHEAEAFAALRRVAERYPGTDWSLRARLREGDALVARREFARAAAVYRSAGEKAVPAAERAELWLLRQRISFAGLVVFGALVVALWLRARPWRSGPGRPWPLPGEVVFLAPLVALLVVLGRAHSPLFWRPVGLLGLAGLLAVYAGGVSFRARPPGRAGIAAWATLGLIAGAGLTFSVLYHFDLLESVVHTWIYGAEG